MKNLFMIGALLALSLPVAAQDVSTTTDSDPTRIEVDQNNNRILFFIEEELQAVLEKGRLTVDGDIHGTSFLHGDVDLKPTIEAEGAQ